MIDKGIVINVNFTGQVILQMERLELIDALLYRGT
jgi:hypothetical protein